MVKQDCDTSIETIFFIVYGFVGVTAFIGNTFACVVFIQTEKFRQSKMNVLLVSLAVWDILMSVFVAPFYAIYCGLGCEYPLMGYCWLMRGAKDCIKIGTTLNVYAITYDRYIAVMKPLQYSSKMTPKKVAAILSTVWILSVILALIRNIWQHNHDIDIRFANKVYDSIIVLGFVVVLVIVMLITNVKIVAAIRKQRQREKRLLKNGCPAMSSQTRKGTVACVTVVLVFVICWIPRAIYNFSFVIDPPGLANPLFFRICFLFLFLQSSLNPFIYWFYRREFRQAAFSVLKCHTVIERAESTVSTLRTVSFLSETGQSHQPFNENESISHLSQRGPPDIQLVSYNTSRA